MILGWGIGRQIERGSHILQHTSGIFVVKYNNPKTYLQIRHHTCLKYMLRIRELKQQFLTSGDLESTESLVISICSPQTIALKSWDLLNISNSEKRRFNKTTVRLASISSLGLRKFDLLLTNSFKFHSNWDFEKPLYCPEKS